MHLIKIVGKPNQTTWSQVHVFPPEAGRYAFDEKLGSHGELMAALSFKAKSEEVEVSSFGTEIINRLQEIYYSNESGSILKKIEQTLESLAAEFLTQVELEAVIGVVLSAGKTYLYAGRNGRGQAVLKRGETKVNLFSGSGEGIETVSGEIKPGDRWLLGTEQLFEIVIEGEIGPILRNRELDQAGESLGALVYGQEHNSRAAAVLAETELVETELIEEEQKHEQEQEPKIKQFGAAGKRWLVNKWNKRPEIRLGRSTRGKKSALSAALILILVFGVSLALAGGKKQRQKQQQEVRGVIEEVQYKYDEAHNLLKLNPLRAKSLLTSSKTRIEEYQNNHSGGLNAELKEWLGKIEIDLAGAQREYRVDSGTEWFDFNLVKDGFKGSDWEAEESKAWVWDETTKTVVEVDLETKASRIVIGGDKIKEGTLVGFTGERGFAVGGTAITVIEAKDGKVVAEVAGEGWNNISDSVGFGSNLYLLDKSKTGQIWKYLGVTGGLSSKRTYLKGESYDLSEAMSMTIDGSVWVLFSDGTIVKYVQGAKDAFVIAGLDKNFEEPIKIFTSPEEKNLYILDRRQTRVVVASKTGEYQAQYEWPGMAGVKDLIVSEKLKKMFLLTGEKVFTIDIQ